jgi:hypothetical protein
MKKTIEAEPEAGSEPEPERTERIYIGGLNPPLLKPSDLLLRLKEISTIEILNDEIDDSKQFFHIFALPLQGESAYDIIAKAYNNVKWKGCRITVQKARLHFLQRLEQERQEAELKRMIAANITEAGFPSALLLRRRLRIRQGYGKEAHKVDTKPCDTNDWNSFNAVIKKMRSRRDRILIKTKGVDMSTQAFYSRGVRLIFDKSLQDEFTHSIEGETNSSVVDEHDSQGEELLKGFSDDSTSSHSVLQSKDNHKSQSNGYVWSTDESEDGSSLDSECQEDSELLVNENNAQESSSKTYMWSSDESESCEHETVSEETIESKISKFTHENVNFDDENETRCISPNSLSESNLNDFNQDVEENLRILNNIFPDLQDVTPKNVSGLSEKKKSDTLPVLMQRYDPTKDSSREYELVAAAADPDTVNLDDIENKNNDIVVDGNIHETTEKDCLEIEQTNTMSKGEKNIYHEARLEEVFRNARESSGVGGFQLSSLFEAQILSTKDKEPSACESSSGTFTFDFSMKIPDSDDAAQKSNANVQSEGARNMIATDNFEDGKDPDTLAIQDDMGEEDSTFPIEREKNQIRGLILPEVIVDSLYVKFFDLNQGRDILQDPEGFRNDEAVQSNWFAERQALTQDWKRKRKYALSKIQQNNKFRK